VKLIASPKNPLNVITSQKVGNLKSGLPIQSKIQKIEDNFDKRKSVFLAYFQKTYIHG